MAEDESIEINRRWMCNIFHTLLVAGLDLKAQDGNSAFEAKEINFQCCMEVILFFFFMITQYIHRFIDRI